MLHLFICISQVYSKILHFFTLKFRSEHISPKSLVCLYLYLTISLSFHLPPPFILIFLLATNLFAIFIFHAVCYSVTSAQLRLWTAAQTQILLCLNPPLKIKIRPPFYLSFYLSGIGTHSKLSATKNLYLESVAFHYATWFTKTNGGRVCDHCISDITTVQLRGLLNSKYCHTYTIYIYLSLYALVNFLLLQEKVWQGDFFF